MLHLSKNAKKASRLRRARKSGARVHLSDRPRLLVNRTPRHIRASIYVFDKATGSCTVAASASSLESTFRVEKGNKTDKAKLVGNLLAKRAKEVGLSKVAFDRGGFKYHGRIKALADAARQGGLDF